mgnify:CR=1 FL=1
MPRVSRIGHRGAAGHAPENTLAAIETGVTLGADFVEIDVRRTADGVLVALHDASVKRTTDGRGRGDALSLRQVRAFKAGNGDRIAIHWEGEPVGDSRTITYSELKAQVCKAANALTDPARTLRED